MKECLLKQKKKSDLDSVAEPRSDGVKYFDESNGDKKSNIEEKKEPIKFGFNNDIQFTLKNLDNFDVSKISFGVPTEIEKTENKEKNTENQNNEKNENKEKSDDNKEKTHSSSTSSFSFKLSETFPPITGSFGINQDKTSTQLPDYKYTGLSFLSGTSADVFSNTSLSITSGTSVFSGFSPSEFSFFSGTSASTGFSFSGNSTYSSFFSDISSSSILATSIGSTGFSFDRKSTSENVNEDVTIKWGSNEKPTINKPEAPISSGEEDEETLFEGKAKLTIYNNNTWDNVAVGILKINKNKKNNKSRLILRREGGMILVLNASIFHKMSVNKTSGNDKVIIFNCINIADEKNDTMKTYSVRFQDSVFSTNFYNKLQELTAIK